MDLWNFRALIELFRGNITSIENEITLDCRKSQIHMRDFYGPLILVSLVYTAIVAFDTKRLACCRGRHHRNIPAKGNQQRSISGCVYCLTYPGLPLPINSMFYRHSSLAYAAGYLCAFNIIAGIFTEHYGLQQAIPNAPAWFAMLYRVLAIAALSCTLLPVFISITRGGFFCWTCGALYSLLQSILLISSFTRSTCLGYRRSMRQATLQFPTFIGFIYLTFYFCQQLIVHRKELKTNWLRNRLNKPMSYVTNTAQYVQSRLTSSKKSTVDVLKIKSSPFSCCTGIRKAYTRLTNPPKGFTYPPILVWSLTVSVLLQYFLINQSLTWFYKLIAQGRHSISERYPDLNKTLIENLAIENARHVHRLFDKPANISAEELVKLQYEFVYYWIDLFWVCICVTTFFAMFFNIINVFLIMVNYQVLSFTLYRHGFVAVPTMKRLLNPFKVTHGTILYPSYQIALMACGFYLQILIYGFIFLFLSAVVTMNAFTKHAFLVHFFQSSWPSILLVTTFGTIQRLAIRLLFTKHRGKSYGYNNTRSLQIYAYFASFYNVIFGLISGVGRILYCPISSAICISRMDISPLGIPLQCMDTSYMAFLGFLYSDVMINNPIMKTFLWILLHHRLEEFKAHSNFDSALLIEVECFHIWLNSTQRTRCKTHIKEVNQPWEDSLIGPSGHGEEVASKNDPSVQFICLKKLILSIRARNRWFLAYTLLRNQDIRKWRKTTTVSFVNLETRVESGGALTFV